MSIEVTECFLTQGALAMLAYLVFFVVYDPRPLAPLISSAALGLMSYILALTLARHGNSDAAGVIGLVTPMHVVITFSWALSWAAGAHLMLLVGASAIVTTLDAQWKVIRAVLVGASVAIFAAIQYFATPEVAWYPLPENVAHTMFTINAVGAVVMLYLLAAVVHTRVTTAQQLANRALEHAGELASTDHLTGLANRRPALARLAELAESGRRRYCLAILDFDHFKDLNDEYGHACGDQVLAVVGNELTRGVRQADMIARWGGEEFLALLPDTGLEDAIRLMERVREQVDEIDIFCGDHTHHVTVSVGLVEGASNGRVHEAIRRADAALYEAKEGGRNQVIARALSA